MPSNIDLKKLSESWRNLSARLVVKYGAKSPEQMKHVEAALERCAEDLEELMELDKLPISGALNEVEKVNKA